MGMCAGGRDVMTGLATVSEEVLFSSGGVGRVGAGRGGAGRAGGGRAGTGRGGASPSGMEEMEDFDDDGDTAVSDGGSDDVAVALGPPGRAASSTSDAVRLSDVFSRVVSCASETLRDSLEGFSGGGTPRGVGLAGLALTKVADVLAAAVMIVGLSCGPVGFVTGRVFNCGRLPAQVCDLLRRFFPFKSPSVNTSPLDGDLADLYAAAALCVERSLPKLVTLLLLIPLGEVTAPLVELARLVDDALPLLVVREALDDEDGVLTLRTDRDRVCDGAAAAAVVDAALGAGGRCGAGRTGRLSTTLAAGGGGRLGPDGRGGRSGACSSSSSSAGGVGGRGGGSGVGK